MSKNLTIQKSSVKLENKVTKKAYMEMNYIKGGRTLQEFKLNIASLFFPL